MFLVNSVSSISASITHLPDGTSYLVAGEGVSIFSQSNGSILITADGGGPATIESINSASGTLGFYDTTPVVQIARVGSITTISAPADTSSVSANTASNFTNIFNKVNALIAKVNSLEAALSQEAGGIGVTE